MAIRLVVFDMAGTTIDDGGAVGKCLAGVLQDAGLTVDPEAVKRVMGLPKPEAIRKLIEASPDAARLRDQAEALHRKFADRLKSFYATDPSIREMPGTSAALASLRKAGIKIALDTGFSRDIVDVLIRRLCWSGPNSPIDATITSDEVPRGRPSPDMIQALMQRLGVPDPFLVAKVGDTPIDLQEGVNAGCSLVIGVTNGSHRRDQLERYPHTHLIDSLADLSAVVVGD